MKARTRLVLALAGVLIASAGWAPASAAPTTTGDRRALVVGISKHLGKSRGTVGGEGDAFVVHRALQEAGFAKDQVLVLVNQAATAAGIRQGLEWLAASRSDSGFSMFHYSGHVVQRGGDKDRDGEKLDEYLMTYNPRQLISDRELSERLRKVKGRMWVDIAGCEAAGFDEGGLSGPDVLVTASSQEHEKSFERPDWKRSVFTGLLVDQGMLQGYADSRKDGAVSVQEAFRYAADMAPRMTANQKPGPQHPYMAGGDGQAWFLKPPPPPAAPPPKSGSGGLCLVLCRS